MRNVKDISIKSYLASRGITPKRETTHSGYYLSPLRSETTPSFHVSYDKNLWHDFGADVGGSIIDLVMQLDNCSVAEAYRKLEGSDTLVPIERPAQVYKPKESTIQIERVEPLQDQYLLNYLSGRGVDIEIAKHYCKEVRYTINGKSYYAIGFANRDGGWELRNEYFQGSTSPKSVTIFANDTDNTLLFEGFIDMLSYLSIKKTIDPVVNVCVLNSVSNLHKAEEFLKTQRIVHCFLDNDEAGRKATLQAQKFCKEALDHSHLYGEYNDLNDYLQHSKRSQRQEAQQPKRGRRM
ncbi:MAG: toprim domain-containing protein [Rikenellaceae bacterium]